MMIDDFLRQRREEHISLRDGLRAIGYGTIIGILFVLTLLVLGA